MSRWFRRHLILPSDHGSWVFLLVPLALGVAAGWPPRWPTAYLAVAALAAFLSRQPITLAVKCASGRRSRDDLAPALGWSAIWTGLAALHAVGLLLRGHGKLLWLALPAVPVFGWYLLLVARRDERRQMGLELLAIGVFALAAPAAYAIGRGALDERAWLLWALCWLQGAASIVHTFLRLAQRSWNEIPRGAALWRPAGPAILFAAANLSVVVALVASGRVAPGLTLAFAVPLVEAIAGTLRPAAGARPKAIGYRQLAVTVLFAILFIIFWH